MVAAAEILKDAMKRAPTEGWARLRFAAEMEKRLLKLPPFDALNHLLIIEPETGAASAWGNLGANLLHLLGQGRSPDDIVESAKLEIENEKMVWLEVYPIVGLRVSSRYDFTQDIFVVPRKTLPQSRQQQIAFNDDVQPSNEDDAALVFRVNVAPAFVHEDGEFERDAGLVKLRERATFRANFKRALTLAGTQEIRFPSSYAYPEERGAIYRETGIHFFGTERGSGGIRTSTVDLKKVHTTMNLLKEFKDQDALVLAIDRLVSAVAGRTLVDKAIDIGMALEIAFMHGDKNANQEIRHKLSLRAAWLLGKTLADRKVHFDTAKAIYDARSNGVHTGKIKKNAYNAQESLDFACACLQTIVEAGEFPDWTMLTLGAVAQQASLSDL